jgi:hypothetical protein
VSPSKRSWPICGDCAFIALQDLVNLVDGHNPTNAATAAAQVSECAGVRSGCRPLQATAYLGLDGLEAVLADTSQLPTSIDLLLVDVARGWTQHPRDGPKPEHRCISEA